MVLKVELLTLAVGEFKTTGAAVLMYAGLL